MLLLALLACQDVDDIPGTPWDVPILVSDPEDPWHRCAPDRDVRVDCTLDGDTFDISACGEGERVRMLGIDAPETEKPGKEADCWGPEAAAELNRLLAGRVVTLSFDRECKDIFPPPNDRTLAWVWMDVQDAVTLFDPSLLDDVLDDVDLTEERPRVLLNEYLLLAGWARRYDEAWVQPLALEGELIAAERLAMVRRQGLWGRCP